MNHICLECGRKLPKDPLFVLENAPASAQDIPDENEVAADRGISLALYRCPSCGLVQFDCEPVPYYRDVIRAGGLSSTMRDLRRRQYGHLIENYHLEGKKFLEVGCGSGEFLKVLAEYPAQAYGIEHREDLVAAAQADGLLVWCDFTETPDTKIAGAPYDVFLSFNFLEHQPEPSVMLQAIYNNLSDEGLGLITVPALEYIAERDAYYELIHDHLAYYSAKTLDRLMRQNGFEVLEEETVNRDTLSVIVRKVPGFIFPNASDGSGAAPGSSDVAPGSSDTAPGESDASLAEALKEGYRKVTNSVEALIVLLRAADKKMALWGAGHQGFTLASTTALGTFAGYIIDSAPFKQGRFAPASHLPIVPPEHFFEDPVDAILIVAPGYTDEIAYEIRSRFGGEVSIFTLRSDAIEELD